VATDALGSNAGRLVRTRLAATITPTAANRAAAPDGRLQVLPGQGGIALGIRLGEPALARRGDHVEPGLSLGHAEPAANRAIQVLSCVGNPVELLDGPAKGARGMVFGKHGAVLAALPQEALALAAPGDRVAIEAQGAGLALGAAPEVTCLSLSPALALAWLGAPAGDGRLRVPVVAELPPEAAAAGIGMPSQRFNMDLHSDQPPMAALCADLAFGDLVAVRDQDHRFARSYRRGWVAVGVISHGSTIAGGHGLGLMTLLTAPASAIRLEPSPEANVARLMGQWGTL
jgi:hypothetical protein